MDDFLENLFNHLHGAASLFATMTLFVGLAAWRRRAFRPGSDAGGTCLYLGLSLLGPLILVVTGFLGGNLQSEWGIGVREITR